MVILYVFSGKTKRKDIHKTESLKNACDVNENNNHSVNRSTKVEDNQPANKTSGFSQNTPSRIKEQIQAKYRLI